MTRYLLPVLLAACGGNVTGEHAAPRDAGQEPAGEMREAAPDVGVCGPGAGNWCEGVDLWGCSAGEPARIATCPFQCGDAGCFGTCEAGTGDCREGHLHVCGSDGLWHETDTRC